MNKTYLLESEQHKLAQLTQGLYHYGSINWNKAIEWIINNLPDIKDTTISKKIIAVDDKELQLIFLPRVKGDLAVRRLRLSDLWRRATKQQKEELSYYTHLDYITATNLMIYMFVHGTSYLADLRRVGMFNDFESFLEKASLVSAHVKRMPMDEDGTKQRLCEISSLSGYLQADLQNWDTEEELEALAQGGNEHGPLGCDWPEVFSDAMRGIQPPHATHSDFISFYDFIEEGKWITAGSSSVGEVQWSYEDESGKFKAKKNMVTDLYTTAEIVEMIDNWDGVLRSRAFVKDEVGKRRLAVSSGLEPYLVESYILHLFGHSFKNWEAITLDESPKEQHNRNCGVINRLKKGAFALPFDFARFDHQPTTDEIKTMISNIAEQCAIPTANKDEFNRLVEKVLYSYSHSIISMSVKGKNISHDVEGGIPSGVRFTSLVGNEWNSIMTRIAQKMTSLVLGYDPILTKGIKGDDTYLLANTAVELYIFRLAYCGINAIGHDSKFGISQRICEFLRNEISVDGVRGWSNRTIPTLSQRKPWNPQPWSPNSEIATITTNIYLLERRVGKELSIIHQVSKIRWSHLTKQSYKWLELPVRLGGFGLYTYDGWVPNCKLPLTTKPVIQVSGLIPFQAYDWITLSPSQLEACHEISITDKIAADDIPGPQKVFGREFINKIRKLTVLWEKQNAERLSIPEYRLELPSEDGYSLWPHIKAEYIPANISGVPDFTKFLREYNQIKKASRYDTTIVIPPLKAFLRRWFPMILARMVRFESQGWHRTDAITLAQGDIPTEPIPSLNPLLSQFVKSSISTSKILKWTGRRKIAMNLANVTRSISTAIGESSVALLYQF